MKIVPSEGQASQFLIMLFPWMWEEGGRRERGGGGEGMRAEKRLGR